MTRFLASISIQTTQTASADTAHPRCLESMMPKNSPRFHPSAGIAIGPILFILAVLAVLAAAMSSGGNDFQVASGADRITADVVAQANLIRSTIGNCNMQYTMALSLGSVSTTEPYPATPTSNHVADLGCDPLGATTSGSLWNSTTSTWTNNMMLPPPTAGFAVWSYVNAGDAGGRCFWTAPTGSNPITSKPIVSGLTRAASKFNAATAYNVANEVIYNPASTSQKFVVWVSMPTGSADSRCIP